MTQSNGYLIVPENREGVSEGETVIVHMFGSLEVTIMFRKLMTFDEAKKAIDDQFKPVFLGEEEAVLLEAYNRVLNEDMVSTLDIPPFNRSTVDGYAVKAEDTFGADENQPVTLKVSGAVNVGEQPK